MPFPTYHPSSDEIASQERRLAESMELMRGAAGRLLSRDSRHGEDVWLQASPGMLPELNRRLHKHGMVVVVTTYWDARGGNGTRMTLHKLESGLTK